MRGRVVVSGGWATRPRLLRGRRPVARFPFALAGEFELHSPTMKPRERNERWMTAGVTAAGVGGGAGAGAVVGASMGIAAFGTAIAATLPFALAGGAIVGLAAYAVRASRKK